MERTFRSKNSIGLSEIRIAPDGRVEVVYLPHDDRLAGRSVPCANVLAALQELFATNAEADPFTLDFHCYNDDEQEEKPKVGRVYPFSHMHYCDYEPESIFNTLHRQKAGMIVLDMRAKMKISFGFLGCFKV